MDLGRNPYSENKKVLYSPQISLWGYFFLDFFISRRFRKAVLIGNNCRISDSCSGSSRDEEKEIQLEIQQFLSYHYKDMLYKNDRVEKELAAGGLVLSLFL